jgi:hypothetical protein
MMLAAGKRNKGLTAETQRGYAATKTRNISRKACPEPSRRDVKHVLSSKVEGAAKKLNFWTWRYWRLGASKSPFWRRHSLRNPYFSPTRASP